MPSPSLDRVSPHSPPESARKRDTPVWVALGATEHRVRYVQVDRWRTRVLEAGQGDTLVLMPGTGGHLEAYAHNVAAFAERFHVIAYDYPGHGYTTHATADLELDTYVEHLAGLLDALGVRKAHLNGESLGGWVAVKFASAHPERVGKLVLNTPGGTMARAEVMEKIRGLSQAAADDPSDQRIRARLEWLMADPATVTDELVAIRQAIYARPGFTESMRHILCLQDPDVRRRNMITEADLAAVPGPALVVWTSDDPSGPAGAGLDMAKKIADGRFELISGAGHWPQWEQSDTFNRIVLRFLTERPLAFVTDEGDARAVPEHERESSSFRCEVTGLGRFQKDGLVSDLATGRTWRLPADEGKYLRGTGLAPAPLMHWAAGLHGDVTSRIAHIAHAESLVLDELRVTVSQRFASQGSFARGEAVGLVFELAWEINIVTQESEARVSSIVDRALRSSPANAAMVTGKEGRFALYIDGRATPVTGLPRARAATEMDPSLRHSRPPRPAGAVAAEDTVLTTWPGANSSTVVLSDDQQGAIGWRVQAIGSYDFESGLVRATVGFPEVAATEQWSLLTDATNRRAPSPLSYFSIGTAFCYHTQLCRYADVRRMPIDSPRLVQTSHFSTSGGAAEAHPVDTHLFVSGGIDDHQANSFLVAAANTCYAHRALSVDIDSSQVTHVAVAATSGEGGR